MVGLKKEIRNHATEVQDLEKKKEEIEDKESDEYKDIES